jgi:hypothetical protein
MAHALSDRWSRFVVRRHRWLALLIVVPVAFGAWAFASGVEIDYGIDAFKVRDHQASDNLDGMTAAVTQYRELATDWRAQLKKLGLKKRAADRLDDDDDDRLDDDRLVDGVSVFSAAQLGAPGGLLPELAAASRKRYAEEQRVRNQWHLQVMLEVPEGDTVFRADVLHFAKELQRRITELPGYEDFCWMPPASRGQCSQPESLLPFFYPSRVSAGDNADSRPLGPVLTDIDSGVAAVLRYGIYYYTDKTFSAATPRSSLFRIQFQFGSPLPGYVNYRDRYVEQEAKFGTWAMANIHPLLSGLETGVDGLRVFYGGDGVTEREILRTIYTDASFATLSLLCIFGLLWLNTESLFIAVVSTFEIALSVPFVYWMYRVVGGIRYLGVLNGISLFLILGIGVDDCLIFFNTFMQLADVADPAERLSITYRRSTKATFITSFTTAAAFAVNLNSAIPALRLFAIFMTLLVVANWLLVIFWYPTMLIFWSQTAHKWRCFDACLVKLRLRKRASADGAAAPALARAGSSSSDDPADDDGDALPAGAAPIDLPPAPTDSVASLRRKRVATTLKTMLSSTCAVAIMVGIVGGDDTALVVGAVCGAALGLAGALTWSLGPQRLRAGVRALNDSHALEAFAVGFLLTGLTGLVLFGTWWGALLSGVAAGLIMLGLALLRERAANPGVRFAALALADVAETEKLPAHFRAGEHFFHDRVAPFIVRWRFVLLIHFLLLIGASAWRASFLRPSEDLPQFFTRSSNLQRFIDWNVGGYYKEGTYSVSQLPVKYGCDKIADSGKVFDKCKVCGGDCTTCVASCDGVGGRTCDQLVLPDTCGVCGGNNSTCLITQAPTTTFAATTMPWSDVPTTESTSWVTTPAAITTTSTASPPTTTTTTTTTSTTRTTTTTAATATTAPGCAAGFDMCGVCGGGNLCVGCDHVANSGVRYDLCGVCGGQDECVGCDGTRWSGKVVDKCGVCDGDGSMCGVTRGQPTPRPTPVFEPPTPVPVGCDGVAQSPKVYDACGVCGGRNACFDCDGKPFGGKANDDCGVCGGDGTSCRGGCDGKGHVLDKCGVCGGKNDCFGCDGSTNTTKKYDACGVCDGDNACVPVKPLSRNLNSIYFVWGLLGIDRSQADINNPFDKFLGDPVFDEAFEFEDPSAQLAIEGTVKRLLNRSDLIVPNHEVNFFPQLRTWLEKEKGTPFPISRAFNASFLLAQFIYANSFYDSMIGFAVNPLRVTFVRARMLSTVDSGTASFEAVHRWDDFQAVLDDANAKSPPTARSGAQASDMWIRVFTEVVAVNGIYYGVILTAIVLVLCLAFFTDNVIVSLLAMLSIGGNLVVMLALYEVWGWTLGAIEAISISILVGLAVDYCFHLAEAYAISHQAGRIDRVAEALTHMGTSVVGGAITTAASAIFLLFCQVEIFHKFGVIVVVNTVFSVVFTFGFFCSMLAVVGPVGHWGEIGYAVRGTRNAGRKLVGAVQRELIRAGVLRRPVYQSFDNAVVETSTTTTTTTTSDA